MEVIIIKSVSSAIPHLAYPSDAKPICKIPIKRDVEQVPSTTDSKLCVKCLLRSYRFNLTFRKQNR